MAPVYVDGSLRTTLRGEGLVREFIGILDEYLERRYGPRVAAVPDRRPENASQSA